MVPDWFSVYEDARGHRLARIHLKVDFAEEIAWAHPWPGSRDSDAVAARLAEYIAGGFDRIEGWPGDIEAWHSDIGHYGYSPIVTTMTLVPALAAGVPRGEDFWLLLLERLRSASPDVQVPTAVGALWQALTGIGTACCRPRDAGATVMVSLQDALSGRWEVIAPLLADYAAQD